MEQDAAVGLAEHRGVVVGIARRHDLEVELLQTLHCLALVVRHAQMIVHQNALGVGLQAMAEERRQAELAHQGLGEFGKGVGQDDDLVGLAQRIQEVLRTRQRLHAGNHGLDVGQAQLVLAQDLEPVLHEGVVVGLVAGGTTQRGYAGALGKFDPDFGNEDPFEV